MNKALIADIQRSSVHDGPGVRTTVFFKGCPLNCKWCHNPECIDFKPQVMFYPEKCIQCGMCDEGCFSGARVLCGKEMTAEQIVKEVLADKDYYGDDGGVTFSGGEPLAQSEVLNHTIDLCRENGIKCAVETSLIYYDETVFSKLSVIMADLKIWDSSIHRQYTGVGNEKIKEHFTMLDKLGIPIIMRTPVIVGVNQEIDKISDFAKNLKNVVQYELLPYHPLGESKRKALGVEENIFEIPSKEYMEELKQYAYIR